MEESEKRIPSLMSDEILVRCDELESRIRVTEKGVDIDGVPRDARLHAVGDDVFHFSFDGRQHTVVLISPSDNGIALSVDGVTFDVKTDTRTSLLKNSFSRAVVRSTLVCEVRAPMPGLVSRIMVKIGQEVKKGDGLFILEAMKMENELRAASNGRIESILHTTGTPVEKGEVIIRIECE